LETLLPAESTLNDIQIEALAKLEQSREEGNRRDLVVLATGTGKTWLSAFDSKQINAKRKWSKDPLDSAALDAFFLRWLRLLVFNP
jgi:superfamily II DNA or RNA helicase